MNENALNCWEFKKCGREPNGEKVVLYGVCPVAADKRADGIHNGKNAGRCCWVMPSRSRLKNTFSCCSGGLDECRECNFYKMVKKDTELLVLA